MAETKKAAARSSKRKTAAEQMAKERGASAVSGLKKASNRSSDEERKRTLAKTTQRRYDSPGAQTAKYEDQTRAFDKKKPSTSGMAWPGHSKTPPKGYIHKSSKRMTDYRPEREAMKNKRGK